MIKVDHATKTFLKSGKTIHAVKDFCWRALPGAFSVVYGKSGSGKSTLLMMMGGMMTPTRGCIEVHGQDLYALTHSRRNAFRRDCVGFIFQKFLLLPYFTVYENIALPLSMKRCDLIEKKVLEIAGKLDLSDRLDHYPSELSIGQQQRVAMARALVKDPDIVLADEPTGNLDHDNRDIILQCLMAVAAAGKVVVAATHDKELMGKAHHKTRMVEGGMENSI